MWFPPALRLLLHILLKLDPTSGFLPLHLLVLVHGQLIQLHKHLEANRAGVGGTRYKTLSTKNNNITATIYTLELRVAMVTSMGNFACQYQKTDSMQTGH